MKNGEYAKIVSRNLRLLMYQTGVTQAKLSRDLKIPKTTISGWLNSNRNPRMDNIDALCHYFNVTRTDLMDDKHGYYDQEGYHYKRAPLDDVGYAYDFVDLVSVKAHVLHAGKAHEVGGYHIAGLKVYEVYPYGVRQRVVGQAVKKVSVVAPADLELLHCIFP